MQGRRDRLNGGALRLVNAARQVLHAAALGTPSGTVVGDTLVFAGFPQTTVALRASTPADPVASGELVNAEGALVKSDLTVGLAGSGADIELTELHWAAGREIEIQAGPTLTHAP